VRRFYEFQKKLPGGGRGALLTSKRLRARTAGWMRLGVMRPVPARSAAAAARVAHDFFGASS
jgi:hypothetical protein